MSKDNLAPMVCWTGGKSKLKKRILALIPKDHDTYVEPFIGGGSVYFSKPLAKKTVINDKDKELISFYKGFKNTKCGQILSCPLPTNKKQFKKALDKKNKSVCNFLQVNKRGYGRKTKSPTFGNAGGSKTAGIKNIAKNCEDYKAKLDKTTILNQDWQKVFKKYDSKKTFTYLDPPYHEAWGYGKGLDGVTPEAVCSLVKKSKGKVLLSYNNHPTVLKACKGLKIRKVATKYELQKSITKDPKNVTELLISNY